MEPLEIHSQAPSAMDESTQNPLASGSNTCLGAQLHRADSSSGTQPNTVRGESSLPTSNLQNIEAATPNRQSPSIKGKNISWNDDETMALARAAVDTC